MRGERLGCGEVVELLTWYLDGTMPPAERTSLGRHLAGCRDCTAYLEQLRATIELSGRLTDEPVPPEVADSLLRAFRAWRAEPDR